MATTEVKTTEEVNPTGSRMVDNDLRLDSYPPFAPLLPPPLSHVGSGSSDSRSFRSLEFAWAISLSGCLVLLFFCSSIGKRFIDCVCLVSVLYEIRFIDEDEKLNRLVVYRAYALWV